MLEECNLYNPKMDIYLCQGQGLTCQGQSLKGHSQGQIHQGLDLGQGQRAQGHRQKGLALS